MFTTKRIYEKPSATDGKRYLVDRLWPRGVRKDDAMLDGWLKDIAPSDKLRRLFHRDASKWVEFRSLYRDELSSPEARQILQRLRKESETFAVTLLFAAKDVERNNAACLKEVLEEQRQQQGGESNELQDQ